MAREGKTNRAGDVTLPSNNATWVTIRENGKLFLTAALFITLTSMAYFSPFPSAFRFGVGVAVMATVLLYFKQLPAMALAVTSGVLIVSTRVLILWQVNDEPLPVAMQMAGPALVYYVVYGLSFALLRTRQTRHLLLATVFKLLLADALSNVVEIMLRPSMLIIPLETVVKSIVGIALIRAILAAAGYYGLRKYHAVILAGEKMARYTEMMLMVAKLKTELFYLKKSSHDIEKIMEKSYWLYRHLTARQDDAAQESLWVARNIHEVKKDYYRIISGIENVLQPSTVTDKMPLSEIFLILEQNTARTLRAGNKDIELTFTCEDDFVTDKQYMLVSILNNLIVNAIEAIAETGAIMVTAAVDGDYCVFTVRDNGCGIKLRDYPLIFKAGYSTKFSPITGKMSMGLGLSHAKNLTEALGGEISCSSTPGVGTCFTVRIPRVALTGEGSDAGCENSVTPQH